MSSDDIRRAAALSYSHGLRFAERTCTCGNTGTEVIPTCGVAFRGEGHGYRYLTEAAGRPFRHLRPGSPLERGMLCTQKHHEQLCNKLPAFWLTHSSFIFALLHRRVNLGIRWLRVSTLYLLSEIKLEA